MAERPPIGVVGVGWVGLVSAACFAELGHDVWCRDIDTEKIATLRDGNVPIYEPGLGDLVSKNRERLHFETELAPILEHARLLFVCVDTPPTYSGDADLSRVHSVINELPGTGEHAIVMKSTVPAGTGAAIRWKLAEMGKTGLAYVSNPEFLQEGSAVADFMHPDRVVVGSDGDAVWAGDTVAELYEPLGGPIVRTDVASAEMIKLASNAFLATKISFINEIANVCEEVGSDVKQVALGMGLDPRIGPNFLNAGIGYGGSCLVGDETVQVRRGDRTWSTTLERLYDELKGADGEHTEEPLEVLSWDATSHSTRFLLLGAVTQRAFHGNTVQVNAASGKCVRCTPDHPFVVAGADGDDMRIKQAYELTDGDWLPVHDEALRASAREQAETPVLAVAPGTDATDSHVVSVVSARTATTWERIVSTTRSPFDGFVYSLEVPDTETFVTTGGLVVHNCFPKDVSALKQLAGNSGYHFQLLTSVIEVNELQKRRVVNKLKKHLGSLVGKEIALLGLAFKPNTDDMREASSVVLAARLQGEGARVRTYDPVAEDRARELITGAEMCDTALDALDGADAVVIVTEWPEFAELELEQVKARMKTPVIVDGRNLLDAERVRSAGFVYEGIGR